MNNDTAINEIQKAIDEIRQNGEQHAEFVRSNGELVIAGLEMALNILNSINPEPCDDTISRRAAIETLKNHLSDTDVPKSYPGIIGALEEWLDRLPSAQPEKGYTKADYIMALHKEYGCDIRSAEKAHDMALEYLRSLSKMKG